MALQYFITLSKDDIFISYRCNGVIYQVGEHLLRNL
jgi:hypothetical protein